MGVAISMVVFAVVLALVRNIYLDGLPETVSAPAAAAVFDTLVRFLRAGLRTVLVVGLVVAGAAFLTGPSTTAVRIRAALSGSISRLRRLSETAGVRTGPVGAWVYRNRGMLRAGVVVVAALAFVFWDRPTGKVVLLLAALAVVALAIIEFLARPPQPGEEKPGGPPGAPAPV
jgi:chromate transport protein ChrA